MDYVLLLDLLPQIPFVQIFETIIDFLTQNLAFLFDFISDAGTAVMEFISELLAIIPPELFIIAFVVLAFYATRKRWGLPIFTFFVFWYILNQGLWADMLQTLTLVIVSALVAVIIGIPLGIWMSKNSVVNSIVQPILDLMQTMPAFVYLIPAVAFFGIGMVPGVFSAVIYAMPPVVRMTNLGIRQVDEEMVEAAESFGSTGWQKLSKVELPLARANIMAGVNQTVLLALSMVVIASMIGAPGLGDRVIIALQQANAGPGFVAGFALVGLAIVLDRILQGFGQERN